LTTNSHGSALPNLARGRRRLAQSQTYRYAAALTPIAHQSMLTSKAQDSGKLGSHDGKATWRSAGSRDPIQPASAGRYVGRYQDYDSTREMGNFWLYDANFHYSAGRVFAAGNPGSKRPTSKVGWGQYIQQLTAVSRTRSLVRSATIPAQSDIRWPLFVRSARGQVVMKATELLEPP